MLRLQALAGNAAVSALLAERAAVQRDDADDARTLVVEERFEPEQCEGPADEGFDLASGGRPGLPLVGFTDRGRVGTVPGGEPPGPEHAASPHAFIARGRTGTIAFEGGGDVNFGPHVNEGAGSIQAQVVPVFEAVSHGTMRGSVATARSLAGTIDVVRSFVGCNAGDQGNGWFVTPAAAARIDAHEQLHIENVRGHYARLIAPLLRRVKEHRTAATRIDAIDQLRKYVRWSDTIAAFQAADRAANRTMGTVDLADVATRTLPVNAGPGEVGGREYMHRVRLPSEPDPT